MDSPSLLHRFDTAQPGKFHLLLMLLTGSCWIWAAYGVTIIGFILPVIKTEWGVSTTALGWLASIGMMGMLVGSILAGTISDHLGRRATLTWTMFYLGLVFILSSLAPNYPILLILRFLTGMGLGGILPAAGTLVAEFSPIKQRGMMMVLLNGFWGLGGTLAAIIGYSLVLHAGWRPALLFGGLSILLSPLIHLLLPESLRFLLSKGQTNLAIKESARVILAESPTEATTIDASIHLNQPMHKPEGGIWSERYAGITFTLWFLWIALNFLYQGVFIWLPTLLAGNGSSIGHSFLLVLFISLGQIPGTLLVAYLADRISRQRLVILSLAVLTVSTILFSLSQDNFWVMVMGFLLMICNGMAWGLAHPFSAELYPTELRGQATGWATGIGRLGGVIAPLLVGWVMQAGGGMLAIFTILAAAPAVTTLLVARMKKETTGRSLEEINTTPPQI